MDVERDSEPDRENLESLSASLGSTVRDLVRTNPGIDVDELVARVVDEVSNSGGPQPEAIADSDDLITDAAYDRIFELCAQHGPLIETADGKLLDLAHMLTDKVFTHRVTAQEAQRSELDMGFDLWALSGSDPGPPVEVTKDPYRQHWSDPAWDERLVEGSVVAVSVDASGRVTLSVLDEEPMLDQVVLESLRCAFEVHAEASDAPASADLLVAEMLLDEPGTFDQPTAPLSQYARRLGLDVRRSIAADDPAKWRILAADSRMERLGEWFDPRTCMAALAVVQIAERIALTDEHSATPTPAGTGSDAETAHIDTNDTAEAKLGGADGTTDRDASLREAVRALTQLPVREAASDELFSKPLGFLPPVDAGPFLDAAIDLAADPQQRAVVHFMRHRLHQQRCEPDLAESELREALREDPQFTDAVDRLAWYASLRGDAEAAVKLWGQIPPHPETSANLMVLEPFDLPAPRLGRNEPCWCGSGRKFKKCHLGKPTVAPLPQRVRWLWRKAFGFLSTTGAEGRRRIAEVAVALAGGEVDPQDHESINRAFSDELTADLVLSEEGYLEQFLDRFGELLPADEHDLAGSWLHECRGVHEVIETDPVGSMVLRDLRTAASHSVTENAFSPQVRPGTSICARLVSDGEGLQILGGTFEVPRGAHEELLEVLDRARARRRGEPVARWAAESRRSPGAIREDAPQ